MSKVKTYRNKPTPRKVAMTDSVTIAETLWFTVHNYDQDTFYKMVIDLFRRHKKACIGHVRSRVKIRLNRDVTAIGLTESQRTDLFKSLDNLV
jgi:hypothetical protein